MSFGRVSFGGDFELRAVNGTLLKLLLPLVALSLKLIKPRTSKPQTDLTT